MRHRMDKMEDNKDGIEPFFPVTFNPSRRADFCVHRNTARCVFVYAAFQVASPMTILPFLQKGEKNGGTCFSVFSEILNKESRIVQIILF